MPWPFFQSNSYQGKHPKEELFDLLSSLDVYLRREILDELIDTIEVLLQLHESHNVKKLDGSRVASGNEMYQSLSKTLRSAHSFCYTQSQQASLQNLFNLGKAILDYWQYRLGIYKQMIELEILIDSIHGVLGDDVAHACRDAIFDKHFQFFQRFVAESFEDFLDEKAKDFYIGTAKEKMDGFSKFIHDLFVTHSHENSSDTISQSPSTEVTAFLLQSIESLEPLPVKIGSSFVSMV